jgi:predicted methyltransferase
MKRYVYSYVEGPVLTKWSIESILQYASRETEGVVDVVVDFGFSRISVRIVGGEAVFPEGLVIPLDHLSSLPENFAYKIINGRLQRLDLYSDGKYYKLKPVALAAPPTLEINGVQMHRTVDMDPWRDTLVKVSALGVLRGRKVLDICTGLGYSAIAEVVKGARRVVTIEKDPNVLYFASLNPWSRGLGDERIEIVLGDAAEVLKELESEDFDAVFHDPPRYSLAGELYSREFYREVYRVLKKGGTLFHYTGEPGKHSNMSFLKGVKKRLEEAGFEEVRWIERAKGFKARKPT